jgi:hypothetical protein
MLPVTKSMSSVLGSTVVCGFRAQGACVGAGSCLLEIHAVCEKGVRFVPTRTPLFKRECLSVTTCTRPAARTAALP